LPKALKRENLMSTNDPDLQRTLSKSGLQPLAAFQKRFALIERNILGFQRK
jgi:hypothetical protein